MEEEHNNLHSCNCDEHHHNEHDHGHHDDHIVSSKNDVIFMVLGIVIYIVTVVIHKNQMLSMPFILFLYGLSYILLGYEVLVNAIKKFLKKDMFDENFLMSIATIGAFVIGQYEEAVAVLLFYKIGEMLQDMAVENSKKKIKAAIDLRPSYANLLVNDKIEKVSPDKVKIGDVIVVNHGEKIPLDGIVIEGKTDLDTSSITGETKLQTVKEGDNICSGTINKSALIKIKVTNDYTNSTVYKIVEMTTDALKNKSNTEKFITKFAKIYTPVVTFLALAIFILFPVILHISWSQSAFRALTFLVVSCPCALVISIPLGFFVGVGICSKNNILVKGTSYIDKMTKVKTFVFDKTGTLTHGKFEITSVNILKKDITKEEFLEYIYLAEKFSNHNIAKSIIESAKNILNMEIKKHDIAFHKEIAGYGIEVVIDNKKVIVGSNKLLENNKINVEKVDEIGTIVHLAVDNVYYGYIILEDGIKDSAKNLVVNLKKSGIKNTVLLTGDGYNFAKKISQKIDIDEFYSELLPADKKERLENIKKCDSSYVAYVGDGINDGPVIALSDVGIAMGNGTDLAVETADVVILNDDLNKLIDLINISKRTKNIVTQNIVLIILVKVLFLLLSGFGIASMWQAVFADVGISIISILNSLRIYNYKSKVK